MQLYGFRSEWLDNFEELRSKRILLDVAGSEALKRAYFYFRENPQSLLVVLTIDKHNKEGKYTFRINRNLEVEEYMEIGGK